MTDTKNYEDVELRNISKLLEKEENIKRVFLDDLKPSYKGRFTNKKRRSEMTDDDQISIVSDAMFSAMLGNTERKMFLCKILSNLLGCDYQYLMDNIDYYKNQFDKDTIESKGQRGDIVLKMGNDYIVMEMNKKEVHNRTVSYSDKMYRMSIKVGEKYVYPEVLSIDINNYSYEEIQRPVEVFWIQTNEHLSYSKKVYIQVYLPKIREECYNEEEEMDSLRRVMMVMATPDRKLAKKLAKGDEILEKYVEEAKRVEETDEILQGAYDHEQMSLEAEREISYSEGIELGFSEGEKSGIDIGEKNVIKSMFIRGTGSEDIHKLTGYPLETIKLIGEELNQSK